MRRPRPLGGPASPGAPRVWPRLHFSICRLQQLWPDGDVDSCAGSFSPQEGCEGPVVANHTGEVGTDARVAGTGHEAQGRARGGGGPHRGAAGQRGSVLAFAEHVLLTSQRSRVTKAVGSGRSGHLTRPPGTRVLPGHRLRGSSPAAACPAPRRTPSGILIAPSGLSSSSQKCHRVPRRPRTHRPVNLPSGGDRSPLLLTGKQK